MDFGFTITGERRVGIRFDEFPVEATHALFDTITGLIEILESKVLAAVPRGKTNRLADAVTSSVNAYPDRIAGYVGFGKGNDPQIYGQAAALEYGAHKRHAVKAHAFMLDHVFDHAFGPQLVFIREAYERTPNIEEHNFLRGSLADMATEIMDALQGTMDQVAGENFSEAA